MIKGISVLNPVNFEKNYLDFCVDYAIEKGYDHFQFIGPIHDTVRGNVDGMTFLRKYAEFNGERDSDYVNLCLDITNRALDKLSAAGVKSYMWHHELDLPSGFGERYPEVLNKYGDVEVTHPIVRDFLENKIEDFFFSYPKMQGLILTLHETKVPLLKLKDQKLGKTERVKYVTEILYKSCKKLGKELIVRPFASIEEDYEMMSRAYEEISSELLIMDKWTQFDWSLTLPHNKFFSKIKKNPIFVEGDIFGEYFGKGKLPLMLKEHIKEKFAYCESFSPVGYVVRADRSGRDPFGTVNEVNLVITHAVLNGDNVDSEIDGFFNEKYGEYGSAVRDIMEGTEDILKKIIYLKGYYFSELSLFPSLNHSKNHFYFEMMKENFRIDSDEWFIPIGWERGSLESVFEEKDEAVKEAEAALAKLNALSGKLAADEYGKLYLMFANLLYVARIWRELVSVFYSYTQYFETKNEKLEREFFSALDKIEKLEKDGISEFGNDFYCVFGDFYTGSGVKKESDIKRFLREVKASFEKEKQLEAELSGEGLYDYVIPGGATEAHGLMKEVNFSATAVNEDGIARIPGSVIKGFDKIKAHGWFSYELKIREGEKNEIDVALSSSDEELDIKITLGETSYEMKEKISGKTNFKFPYKAKAGEKTLRIRFDKISASVPYVYCVKVK